MWWEVITELAYKMALDCGQAPEFFQMVDELSKQNGSQQKISSQSALSTLLGPDLGTHRKRGRDPIRRISHFNGLLDDDDNDNNKQDHPESVLVKRSKHPQEEPVRDMMSILKSTPVDINDRQSMSLSISPVKTTEKIRPSKTLTKDLPRSSQPKSTTDASQQRSSSSIQNMSSKANASRSPPLRILSTGKKQVSPPDSDSSRIGHRKSRFDVEKKPSNSASVRSGKPGLAAEKHQKAKRRSSTTKSTTKEYVVNRLKSVKANDNGELVYLVEWQGDWDDTWEPYHFVAHLEDDIEHVYQNASPDVQAAMRMSGHMTPVD